MDVCMGQLLIQSIFIDVFILFCSWGWILLVFYYYCLDWGCIVLIMLLDDDKYIVINICNITNFFNNIFIYRHKTMDQLLGFFLINNPLDRKEPFGVGMLGVGFVYYFFSFSFYLDLSRIFYSYLSGMRIIYVISGSRSMENFIGRYVSFYLEGQYYTFELFLYYVMCAWRPLWIMFQLKFFTLL